MSFVKKAYVFIIFFLCLFCLSCKKKPTSDVEPVVPADVYVTLSNTFGIYGQYWKNGEIVQLATPNVYPNTKAIFASDNDIYVVGNASLRNNSSSFPFVGQYWKNGVVSNVENGISATTLYDVFVSEGNVYISGEELNSMQKNQAAYWKNGVLQSLPGAVRVSSVFVFNKDVYVAGEGLNNSLKSPMYWKMAYRFYCPMTVMAHLPVQYL